MGRLGTVQSCYPRNFRPAVVLVVLGLLVACTTTTTGNGTGAGRKYPATFA
jgi:hypothetical protein